MKLNPFVTSALMSAAALASAGCASIVGQSPIPQVLEARNVTVTTKAWASREALQVVLSRDEQAAQLAGAGSNRPSYAIIDEQFADGLIEIDVAAIQNGRGGANARGFAGIAFHLSGDGEEFEAVYLRMDNGALNSPAPDAPRNVRAIQYVAHPDFHFEVSRELAPGQYERAAPLRTGDWHRLRLEIDGASMTAFVDGTEVLRVDDLKRAGLSGRVALWVGDGSDAYFRNLVIRRSD